jgi:hypothetical protein
MKLRNFAILAAVALSLQGCLVFIPGKVVGAISDGMTGAEGESCVSQNAKVGDKIRMPYNGIGVVKSLSGTSIRCTNSEMPIRALVVVDETWGKNGKYGDVYSVCLPVTAKVGDKVDISAGMAGSVKSIYGASPGCPKPELPLRALAKPD